jgi:hypothetical protein
MEKFNLDFIGVGGMKCASSWLTFCMEDHPKICFPKERKELHFFNEKFSFSGIYKNWKKNTRFEDNGLKWYKSQFRNCKKENIKGEFSTQYLADEVALKRIKKLFPKVKILMVLRNPVNRAYSEYLFNQRYGGHYKNLSFEEAIEKNPYILEKGLYGKYVKMWMDNFKKVKVVFLDDIKKNPKKIVRDTYDFLGVEKNFVPKHLNVKVNARKKPKFKFVNDSINFAGRTAMKSKLLFKIATLVGLDVLARRIVDSNVKDDSSFEEMKEETKKKLIKFYEKDVKKLEKISGKNLQNWLK